MAKLRHIALAVPDPEKAAKFYSEVFDMKIIEPTESPIASGVYLSDGTICLALLNYKTDEAAGKERGKHWVGTHHFGFWVDDLDTQRKAIEAHGGIGYTWEFGMHVWLKRALFNQAYMGMPQAHRARVAAMEGWVAA